MIPFYETRLARITLLSAVFIVLLAFASQDMPVNVIGFTVILGAFLVWLSIVDLENLTIPNLAVLLIALTGLLFLWLYQPEAIFVHVLGGIIGFLAFWGVGELFFRIRKVDGLGMGDAKLLGAGGVWVGIEGLTNVVFLASVGGILFVAIARLQKKHRAKDPIPFGPFLSVAMFVVWIYGAFLF